MTELVLVVDSKHAKKQLDLLHKWGTNLTHVGALGRALPKAPKK